MAWIGAEVGARVEAGQESCLLLRLRLDEGDCE